jgi:hypothetical protein
MCDATDYAVGAVLGQRKEGRVHAVYYARKTLSGAQLNYATTEKELLAVVFAFEKFRSYVVNSKVIVYTDHAVRGANCTDEQYAELLEQMAPIAEQVAEKLNLQ